MSFDQMIDDFVHENNVKYVTTDIKLLSRCVRLEHSIVQLILSKLKGLRKFHVYIHKYISIMEEETNKTKPYKVYLGRNRKAYTFPNLRSKCIFFYHPDVINQWKHISYVPCSPSDLFHFIPPQIQWKAPPSDLESDSSYESEDEDFDPTGMSWGDMAVERDERRAMRLEREKLENGAPK